MLDIRKTFESFTDDYSGFDDIVDKLHPRSDICAMLMLDKLLPGTRCIVGAAEHDIIYFDVDVDELSEVAIESDIRDLCRCGVMHDGDGLSMFV